MIGKRSGPVFVVVAAINWTIARQAYARTITPAAVCGDRESLRVWVTNTRRRHQRLIALTAKLAVSWSPTDAGHGRIEQRECRAADAIDWLTLPHRDRQNLRGIAAITARRINKKTGQTSVEMHCYITSSPAGHAAILAAARAIVAGQEKISHP